MCHTDCAGQEESTGSDLKPKELIPIFRLQDGMPAVAVAGHISHRDQHNSDILVVGRVSRWLCCAVRITDPTRYSMS